MPYYTDTVASFTLLKSTIETNCVANGWTLSDDILSKDSCFFKLVADTTNYLQLWGGLSQTGSTLNSMPTHGVQIKSFASVPITWPITYHLFIFNNPSEVYCFIEYNSGFFQQLSFGKSNLTGIGLGAWFTGMVSTYNINTTGNIMLNSGIANVSSIGYTNVDQTCGLFIGDSYYSRPTSYIYSDLDGGSWKYNTDNSGPLLIASHFVSGLLTALPNASNQSTVLLPIKAVISRSSGGLTIVANLINSRLLRIDNHESKSLVTFGSDQWMVFPWYRRDVVNRNGSGTTPINHSGTFGFAIRYGV